MNRRDFIKRLGLGVAAVAIPLVVIPITVHPGFKFHSPDFPLTLTDIRRLKQQLISRNVHPNMTAKVWVYPVHPLVIEEIKRQMV